MQFVIDRKARLNEVNGRHTMKEDVLFLFYEIYPHCIAQASLELAILPASASTAGIIGTYQD